MDKQFGRGSGRGTTRRNHTDTSSRSRGSGHPPADLLLNVRGYQLVKVREGAGLSRPKLSRRMKLDERCDEVACSPNTLLRYEDEYTVKPVVVEAYRFAIGEGLFDALLQLVREAEAAATERHERSRNRRG